MLDIVRVQRGSSVRATLRNDLPQHTTIHWHGIRVPNAMDGVQYITQPPVQPGETFTYEFTPPDSGTFFFHPHCNESGQSGRGLLGILIVDGDELEAPDHEIVLTAKDWRLNPDGTYLPFVSQASAGKAGTFGTVRTVNGEASVREQVPAGADVRIRILNLDSTRIMELGIEGGPAAIIATDGNPLSPISLDTWRLGPAMRLDLLVRTPAAGETLRVVDYFASQPFVLAELEAAGAARRSRPFAAVPLKPAELPEADVGTAERQTYTFGPASEALVDLGAEFDPDDPLRDAILDSLCVGSQSFWAINKQAWPTGDMRRIPPPLAKLVEGRHYVFTLQNATPHAHPIHLHGHTFKVLSSSRREVPPHHADTVLLAPKERLDIAFVARRGKWMFHCHILDHQESGMMGYFDIA
jgi:FtsP/CotA-like multicopper oxidase with cupredoxin domain